MEQAAQTFNWAALAIPLLLCFVPGLLFYTGRKFSRRYPDSFAGKSFHWLGGHGVTLVLVTALTLMRGPVPDMVVTQLPLIVTAVYLVAGFIIRSPFLFSLGLATPGLWVFVIKSWQAFSGATESLYSLPQDPFWYLLAAAVIFCLQYLQKPKEFWDEAEASLAIVSGSYLMGAFWLLALGQASLFSSVGIAQWIWAVLLTAVSSFLLWCARYLRDPLFAACAIIGLSAGVYTFISHYPWG
jgi:hypothetical protein